MTRVKTHEQTPASPGSFEEFSAKLTNEELVQDPLSSYAKEVLSGNFAGSYEEYLATTGATEEGVVATNALQLYTQTLAAYKKSLK